MADNARPVRIDRRMYLTEDRSRAVPDGDPEARFLLCAEGGELPQADARRYGLLEAKADDEPQSESHTGENTPEGPAAKRSRRPADKSRRPAADKTGE